LVLIATSDYYENGWPTRFQKAFTPRMHLQGKALQNAQHRVIISYCALCKPADGIFSQFFYFCRLTAGFESRMLFYVPKMLFPSPNSADISSTSQDSYCTAERKIAAEGKHLVRC